MFVSLLKNSEEDGTWSLSVPTLNTYNRDLFAVVFDGNLFMALSLLRLHCLPGGKGTRLLCQALFKYHSTSFAYCTLNHASNWPADISWQPGEDIDLLNTWHSAAKIKCAFGTKRKLQSQKTPQQNWPGVEMDGLQKCMHSFLPPPPLPPLSSLYQ